MLDNLEVLILCGGEGTRLRSIISDVPKPMAPIGEKPFLDYLVRFIADQGFNKFCFLTGYKWESIHQYALKYFNDLQLRFSHESHPLGTGGAILQAVKNSKHDKFLVINGDTFFNINLLNLIQKWEPSSLLMALKQVDDSSRYGRVEINSQNQVIAFLEKSNVNTMGARALINAGIYVFHRNLFHLQRPDLEIFSLEQLYFPQLLKLRKIQGLIFTDDFIDIGIPEDYIMACSLIPRLFAKNDKGGIQ